MNEPQPAYIVANVDIHDRESYRTDEAGFAPILIRHGGRILGVEEDPRFVSVVDGFNPTTS